MTQRGVVYLVGAGPGDPSLITVKGLEAIRRADVLVYDRLVAAALLAEAPLAERIFAGKRCGPHSLSQAEITALLIMRARAGRTVVRLKGGDPFVFGRGGEEAEALRDAGIPFEIIPGVTSAIAAPASAGIPVTDRRYGSAFAVVTGHQCDGGGNLDWEALARIPTVVVLMGLHALADIAASLMAHGADPSTPAAVVASATLPGERHVTATLATIAAEAQAAELKAPATLVVGEVVRLGRRLAPGEQLAVTGERMART